MISYPKELKSAIRAIKPPYNIIVDLTINPDYPGYLGIRLYENQVMSLSEEKQLSVMEYLHKVRLLIESFNVKCFFDGVAGDPPRSTNVS